jgi:DNA-binding response OmpR family regulator
MRDPGDIIAISELQTKVNSLENLVDTLKGSPADYAKLRPYGFNPRMCRMLVVMAKQYPATLSRVAIMTAVGGDSRDAKSMDVLVCKARKIIEDKRLPGVIETIHGGGYRADDRLTSWVKFVIKPEPVAPEQQTLFGDES